MRIRPSWLLGVVLLVPGPAHANDHKWDLAAGLTYNKGSSLFGLHETFSKPAQEPADEYVSFIADFSQHWGSSDADEHVTRTVALGGVRGWYELTEEHLVFAQFLVGTTHDHVGLLDRTDPAVAFGGGYEFEPGGHESTFAVRFQFDYVHVFRGGDGFPRPSVAIVYRRKDKPQAP